MLHVIGKMSEMNFLVKVYWCITVEANFLECFVTFSQAPRGFLLMILGNFNLLTGH